MSICQSKLREVGYRRLKCPSCRFEGDRDHIGALNVRMKALPSGLDCSRLYVNLNGMREKPLGAKSP